MTPTKYAQAGIYKRDCINAVIAQRLPKTGKNILLMADLLLMLAR